MVLLSVLPYKMISHSNIVKEDKKLLLFSLVSTLYKNFLVSISL